MSFAHMYGETGPNKVSSQTGQTLDKNAQLFSDRASWYVLRLVILVQRTTGWTTHDTESQSLDSLECTPSCCVMDNSMSHFV
eukprot:4671216-Amphidinium_carterae.2